MNTKLAWLVLAAALAVPAGQLAAQGMPPQGPEDEEMAGESAPGREMGPGGPGMEPGGPGRGGPGMRGGRMGPRGGAWAEEDESEGEPRQAGMKGRKMQGPGGMGMGPGMGRGMMSDDEIMGTIKKYDAAFGKKMDELKIAAIAKYRMVMGMAGKMLAGAKMEEDPALEKDAVRGLSLEFETKELARKYDKASDSEKAAIKTELKAKLSELFDLKTKGQEFRMKQMEKKISKLKEELEKRKANKAKIVDQRIEQMTGEGYGW